MAIKSAGYDGTVDEVQFAGMLPKAGASEYGVDKAADFRVTAVAGQDRTLSIASGTAWGHSVVDQSDANVTVQLAPLASGSRWDMIVLRRDWQPPGGATTVEVIQGGASGLELPWRNNNPGVRDDQPLALIQVRAGQTQPGEIVDLRCWGRNGGVYTRDTRALQYMNPAGGFIIVNREAWFRWVTPAGTVEWRNLIDLLDIGTRLYNNGAVINVGNDGRGSFLQSFTAYQREYNEEPNLYISPDYKIGRATKPVSRLYDRGAVINVGQDGRGSFLQSYTAYARTYDEAPNLYITPDFKIGRATRHADQLQNGSHSFYLLGGGSFRCEGAYNQTANIQPNVYVTSNGTFGRSTASSSLREYKTNIRAAGLDPADILALEPVIYDRKDGSGDNELGLIAQDVEKAVPQLALYEDGRLEGVRYDRLPVAQQVVLRHHSELIAAQADEIHSLKDQLQEILKLLTK